MKKSFIILAIILNIYSLKAEICWKLISAIQDCDFKKYEEYIKQEKITPEKKHFLIETINDIVKIRSTKTGKGDLRVWIGSFTLSVGLVSGLLGIIGSMQSHAKLDKILAYLLGSAGLTALGLYHCFKGAAQAYAYGDYINALLIKEHIYTLQV